MKKEQFIKKECLDAGLPLARVYTRVIPHFGREMTKDEFAVFETIYRDADSDPNKEDVIKRECNKLKIPLDRTDAPVEVYFTRTLTNDEAQKFEFIYYDLDYVDKRIVEYPPLTEFVDAYYHQQKGDVSFMTAYFAKVEAVKIKYPSDKIVLG